MGYLKSSEVLRVVKTIEHSKVLAYEHAGLHLCTLINLPSLDS